VDASSVSVICSPFTVIDLTITPFVDASSISHVAHVISTIGRTGTPCLDSVPEFLSILPISCESRWANQESEHVNNDMI
jgi:hypothetical protein